MNDWPIGLSTGCFYQTKITEVLEDIRTGGFTMVEICSSPAHLDYHDVRAVQTAADAIRGLGIDAFSFHAPFARHIDITSLEREQRERSLREMTVAAEAAAAFGVGHFVIHPGPEESDAPPVEKRYQRLEFAAQSLGRLADTCAAMNMRLMLENMLPHLLFGSTADLLWIFGAIENNNVGICLDTGHAHLSGDIGTVLHKVSGHLNMLHLSDNNGHSDDHFPPGKGRIHWESFMQELSNLHFSGSCILELAGNQGRTSDQILAGAREACCYLRKLCR